MTSPSSQKASAKTIGLMGDDLAVNSEQMIGLSAKDEFPVVENIFGITSQQSYSCSFHFRPYRVFTFRTEDSSSIGRTFSLLRRCREDFRKAFQKITKATQNKSDFGIEERIKGAIKTDFILSIEILAIALDHVKRGDVYNHHQFTCGGLRCFSRYLWNCFMHHQTRRPRSSASKKS